MKRKICVFIMLIFSVVLLCGCGETKANNSGGGVEQEQEKQLVEIKSKVFTKDGLSITLTENFTEEKMDNFVAIYYSSEISVMLVRELINLNSEFVNYTVVDYGNAIRTKYSNYTPSELQSEDDLTWFEYTFYNEEVNIYYHYFIYIFKRTDAFWLVEFAVTANNKDVLKDTVHGYAKSVTFEAS